MAKVAIPPERLQTKDGNEQPLVAYATPLLYCMAAWKSMQNRGYLLVGVAVRRDYPVMTQSYAIPPADYEMWKRGEPMNETTLFDYPYRLFLMERLEFVLLCQDELEAKVLRIVEYEMLKAKEVWQALAEATSKEHKTPPCEPQTYWVQLSHAQFLSRLYKYDTGKVGSRQPLSMSKGTLRKALNSLLAKQLLLIRARPGDEFGAPEYTLNRPLIQEKLNALPADPFHVFCPGRVASPEPDRDLQNLQVPPAHSEKGDLQNTQLPPPTSEQPQVQNLHIFKYTKQESLKENKEYRNSDIAHTHTFTNDFFSLLTLITALTPDQKHQLTQALLPRQDFSYSHRSSFVQTPAGTECTESTVPTNVLPPVGTGFITSAVPAGAASPHVVESTQRTDGQNNAHDPTRDSGRDESHSQALRTDRSVRVALSCTKTSLTDATPIAPPEKPGEDTLWTPQTCLELADYYRGETLPESGYENSPYQRAVQAAISLVNKQRATYSQVDAVFRYMCGRDETVKDSWWANKKVDLWHVAEHCSVKLREIERKSLKAPDPSSTENEERPSVLVSEEVQQRNLERLRTRVAATRAARGNTIGTELIPSSRADHSACHRPEPHLSTVGGNIDP